jgi:hypothetical protein
MQAQRDLYEVVMFSTVASFAVALITGAVFLAVDVPRAFGAGELREQEVLTQEAQPVAGLLPVEAERRGRLAPRGGLLLAVLEEKLDRVYEDGAARARVVRLSRIALPLGADSGCGAPVGVPGGLGDLPSLGVVVPAVPDRIDRWSRRVRLKTRSSSFGMRTRSPRSAPTSAADSAAYDPSAPPGARRSPVPGASRPSSASSRARPARRRLGRTG